jgi:glycosyltransferase involved in cell wall biosynthesis
MKQPAIWFPTVRTNTGTDHFTKQLVEALNHKGIKAEITWLPHRAEYLPWLTPVPQKPEWANIVHINSWLAPRFIPKGIPLVTTVHLCVQDPVIRRYKSLAQHLYHKFWVTPIERYSIEHAHVVTCVSLYTKNKVQDIFKINNVELIYNGIDVKKFKSKEKEKMNQPFRLLFVGTNSLRKGFDLLPLIMRKLGSDYELIFTSVNPDPNINLPQNMKPISYRKTQEELLALYHDVDALIFPSRLEGFGLVVAEAMACGLPVIAANSSAVPEIIDNKINGIICKKDDIDEFVAAVKLIKEDDVFRAEIIKNAQHKISNCFDHSVSTQNYINLYNLLLRSL